MLRSRRVKELFHAVYLHLRTDNSYNFFKYNKSFSNLTPDRVSDKLSRKLNNEENTINFFFNNQVTYYLKNNVITSYIGNFDNPNAFEIHNSIQSKFDNRSYVIKNSLQNLKKDGSLKFLKDFDEIIDRLFLNKIDFFTIGYLNSSLKLSKYWFTEDPLNEEYLKFIILASDFFPSEKKKIINILKKMRNDSTI